MEKRERRREREKKSGRLAHYGMRLICRVPNTHGKGRNTHGKLFDTRQTAAGKEAVCRVSLVGHTA